MRPRITLDEDVVRENVRLWRAHAGVPVWAVVKADGYGWGARRLIAAIDREVEGYVVADAEDAAGIRTSTSRPIALLAASPAPEVAGLLERGVIPNLATPEAARAAAAWARGAGRPARVRVGIVPAAGWAGLLEDGIAPFAAAAGAEGEALEVELWTHLTAPSQHQAQRARFARARATMASAGVRIVALDVAGTYVSAREGRSAEAKVRIGIGLFGVRGESAGPPVRSAIGIEARVVDVLRADRVAAAGYREPEPWPAPWLAVVRCGYSDGLPSKLAGTNEILSIGMQYAVLGRKERQEIGDTLRLLDTSRDLDSFLDGRVSPHEFVVGIKEER